MKTNVHRYSGEVAIAALIVAVVALMILPLPTLLIDMLLSVNITLSVVLLTATMYVPSATSLSSFPSLLLFTTLLRLSLNIASTKSILLHADAGHIIESFGELVVGGNLVVGLVVFLIITTVQFIVIAKGSERVAEVGARFTLDAMPGKQMSIDADVRAGNLTGEEARKHRALLAVESQLHGGMDGAMKFVKGDAIAGLVITMVNIVAGIVIGVTYHGMTAGEAASRFAVLSIGDAMVSQIPSLLISVAAGVMITRVANDHDKPRSLGMEIAAQLSTSPRALWTASILLCGFALVPGFPSTIFLVLASAIFIGGRAVRAHLQRNARTDGEALASLQREGAKKLAGNMLRHAPSFAAPLAVKLSTSLATQIDSTVLNEAFEKGRRAVTDELGLPFPGIVFWADESFADDEFEVLIHDVPVARDVCAATSADSREVQISKCVVTMLRREARLFIGVQETQWIMERATPDYPNLVTEVQKAAPVQRIAEVLRRLLEEQVPIRDIRAIMESLVAWGPKEKDLIMLTEYVRSDLGRMIAHRAAQGQGRLPAIVLDQSLEQTIRQAIKPTPAGNFLTLEPHLIEAIVRRLAELATDSPPENLSVVTAADIRRYFRRLIEKRFHWMNVYSFQELNGEVDLRMVGQLSI
ncbi:MULTISPECIES: FHIPEP family type III secretion protein [Pandoraea]|uniref:FHIPEP family type III secretion protein n=1 Tax=Pandoraea TaxID=93217 RepID=UPI001F5CBFB1|nr:MULTISPECIES: FHIPEP family type III secretion protein [Pandoraea]MCI3208277.1 EscV/YscV/HrcV family type III secretion system export apparatus protein [Pandoraea sp. LA3]MDN4586306.1 EscV/YscV/HrcV family type III secretion system export apparatus protein [Pandoraea capi]